ncbi:hypothetical protein RRG08_009432 [Elysia crispata]|uniref:Uncharacterized protein n=1 Tax=Elysia crispata TaxID=231223 RepID=A0AAE0Y9L3_9GAST|nr:hypothetical protein RRG08_009432 [Elysia crispata]
MLCLYKTRSVLTSDKGKHIYRQNFKAEIDRRVHISYETLFVLVVLTSPLSLCLSLTLDALDPPPTPLFSQLFATKGHFIWALISSQVEFHTNMKTLPFVKYESLSWVRLTALCGGRKRWLSPVLVPKFFNASTINVETEPAGTKARRSIKHLLK